MLAARAQVSRGLGAIPTWFWPSVASAAFLASAAFGLTEYPPVYGDEPWDLSAPISILRGGGVALPMFGESYSGALYYNVYLAAFIAVLGVDIGAARLVSVAHGAALIIVAYLLAREFGLRRAAVFVAFVVPLLFPFAQMSRYVRPEIICTLYGSLGVWLALVARRRHDSRLHFAAGVSATFAAAIFPLAIWALLLIQLEALVRRDFRAVAITCAGGGLALLPLAVFIAHDPNNYTRFLVKFGGSSLLTQRTAGPLDVLGRSLTNEPQRYAEFANWAGSWFYPLTVVTAAMLGILFAIRDRGTSLLTFVVVPALVLGVLGYNKTPGYLVVLTIPIGLVLGALARANTRVGLILLILVASSYSQALETRTENVATDQRAITAAYADAFRDRQHSVVIGSTVAYAYFLNDTEIEFRAFHIFCRFQDFKLDSPEANAAKLTALARGRPIFLIFEEASFFYEMLQFDFDGSETAGFQRFVHERFTPEVTLSFKGTPYGDYNVIIARYWSP